MQIRFDRKLQRNVYEIWSGQYYASAETNIVLTTLLGSCIAVCLIDELNGVVGMNHFMLPGDFRREDIIKSPDARYGIHAMELLINKMMKLGAQRKALKAKIFGGGHVLNNNSFSNISEANIEFARTFMQMEQIPIISENVAGSYGRKIYFFSKNAVIYVKRIYQQNLEDRIKEDQVYINRIKQDTKKKGKEKEENLTLF